MCLFNSHERSPFVPLWRQNNGAVSVVEKAGTRSTPFLLLLGQDAEARRGKLSPEAPDWTPNGADHCPNWKRRPGRSDWRFYLFFYPFPVIIIHVNLSLKKLYFEGLW